MNILNRTQKLQLNTIVSLISKVTIMLSGLILPRLILTTYGSDVNGLVNSITQFLSIITFLDLGVGSVVQAALYKPLANNDSKHVSQVLKAAMNYFRRIAFILILYVGVLIIVYPVIANDMALNRFSTSMLIVAISISTFAQYYFGIINELLLNADQKGYVQLSTEILVVILNLILSVILILNGFSIVFVKFIASLVILIRPIYLSYYVRKHYDVNMKVKLDTDPLPQKWSGMGQHIAYSIQNSTDIVILTMFSSLSNVSVYSVYNMIVHAISLIISSFTTGLQSFFGNLLANNEQKKLEYYFSFIEWIIHTSVTLLYGLTAVLIIPFISLYTKGVNDVNYYLPIFAILIVLTRALFSLRTPYQAIVFAASHFRQTQLSSYIEAGLNIVISLILVHRFGLIGVAIGSLVAVAYRILYLIYYLSNQILHRKMSYFFKQLIVDCIVFVIILVIGNYTLSFITISNYLEWIIFAAVFGLCVLIFMIIINIMVYPKNISIISNRILRIF